MVAQMTLTKPSGWQNSKDMDMKEAFVGKMEGWHVSEYQRTNVINKKSSKNKSHSVIRQWAFKNHYSKTPHLEREGRKGERGVRLEIS